MSITLRQIQGAVRQLVEEKPDYVYTMPDGAIQCLYLDPNTGEGSCLIGQALLALGVRKNEFDERNWMSAERLPFWDTEETANWARCVQREQDDGKAWGNALEAGEERFQEWYR
jgi:hypothetical protein